MKKYLAVFLAAVMLVTAMGTVAAGASSETTKNPLDTGKEIMYYLFWTADDKLENDRQDLQTSLALSDDQMGSLKELGLAEHQNNSSLKANYASKVRSSTTSTFNTKVLAATADRNETAESILGDRYSDFRNWIASWWEVEREYRMNPIETDADIDRIDPIWATQYVPNTSGALEVALPDKYIKFANLGWDDTYDDPPYVVNVYSENYDTTLLGIRVDEVGPWNENDNYWDNDRRIFTDLDLGVPEAQAAFYDDYNGGENEFGDIVLNPAGIDLSTEAAEDLGYGTYESGWVAVRYEYLP